MRYIAEELALRTSLKNIKLYGYTELASEDQFHKTVAFVCLLRH